MVAVSFFFSGHCRATDKRTVLVGAVLYSLVALVKVLLEARALLFAFYKNNDAVSMSRSSK